MRFLVVIPAETQEEYNKSLLKNTDPKLELIAEHILRKTATSKGSANGDVYLFTPRLITPSTASFLSRNSHFLQDLLSARAIPEPQLFPEKKPCKYEAIHELVHMAAPIADVEVLFIHPDFAAGYASWFVRNVLGDGYWQAREVRFGKALLYDRVAQEWRRLPEDERIYRPIPASARLIHHNHRR